MKIGIDARAAKWYRGTGIGTYTHELLRALNKIDIENKYSLFLPEKCNINIDFNDNIEIVNINTELNSNFWHEVSNPNTLTDDSLNLYHVPQNGIGLPYKKTCPFVITLHDIIPCKMPETVSDNYLRIFEKEMPRILPLCDGIITVSEHSKKDIIDVFNFPEEKIFVTHLAAEEVYIPLNKQLCKDLIKREYKIKDDFILYIGGFSPRKNIIGLIESFYILKQKTKSPLKLVIAGTHGISYNIYKKRVDDLHLENDVLFPGFISLNHMPYLYNACELFVYPSFYEGFGLPPLEAMACGIPVITSNLTSIPEIVKDSCLLINPYDTEDLSNAMAEVLENSNLKENLILKGVCRSKELTWEKTACETLRAYKEISKSL